MLLQVQNLTKTYYRHNGAVYALDDLSLDIPKGAFVTITGPSGSGKTTLLLILGGLLRPTAGRMFYNGNEVNLYSEEDMALFRSHHVGFVMQNFALIPYLTASENIMIALNARSKDTFKNKQRAEEVLARVGLENRATHYPRELSAGQQQRVAIARALANSPDLLLADEPTGNLDPSLSEEILGILKEINEQNGTTVVMVTHSPTAAHYGNVRVHLQAGRIHSEERKPSAKLALS